MKNEGPNWLPQEKYDEIIQLVPLPGVNAIIVDGEGKILLVHRKNPPMKGEWWIPGGSMRFGESILETLTREVKEETGLDVEEAKLAHIISNFWDLTGRQTVEINFLVKAKRAKWVSGSSLRHGESILECFAREEKEKRAEAPIQLDNESDDWKWADPNDPNLNPHLRRMLRAFSHQVLSYQESNCKFRIESPTAQLAQKALKDLPSTICPDCSVFILGLDGDTHCKILIEGKQEGCDKHMKEIKSVKRG